MSSIEPLKSLTLELPPCCIEFWPLDPQFAVVGTYNLEKAAADEVDQQTTQQRNGSLILVQVREDDV
jgi:diphthamide biosynthesis protein 7